MKVTDAELITGKHTATSKMPCDSFDLPTFACRVGNALRGVRGSACEHCYACKGFATMYPAVETARVHRLELLKQSLATPEGRDRWVCAMVRLIDRKRNGGYFRWHSAGDIQSAKHLDAIVEIARRLPHVKFWLPTQEYGDVFRWTREHGSFPVNLTVRLSARWVDVTPKPVLGLPMSMQHTDQPDPAASVCPAVDSGACGECRACWDPGVRLVSYRKH